MSMQNRFSRIFSVLLAGAAAALCAVPGTAEAVTESLDKGEPLTDGTFTYELVSGSYTITKCDENAIITEIPELRNGYAVTAIGEGAFAGCSFISELTIPSSIKTISGSAFAGCTSLEKVVLPEGLKNISSSTFMGCTLLTDVTIPDTVTVIENYAFYGCDALSEMKLPASLSRIGAMAFADCSNIDAFDASDCANYTFQDGILYNAGKTDIVRASTKLSGDLYIEDTVETIEPGAFSVCTRIENLYFPSSVTYIGDDAFGYCSALKKVDFAEGLSTISAIAFKYCTSLEAADLPTTLQTIEEGAFYNCQSLARVTIPNGTESIGAGAFADCPRLTNVAVPSSVTEIGDNAFGFTIDTSTGEYNKLENFSMSVFTDSAGESYARDAKIDYTFADRNIKRIAFLIIAAGLLLAAAVFAVVLMVRSSKSAPLSARKAEKQRLEKEAEENYKKILDD